MALATITTHRVPVRLRRFDHQGLTFDVRDDGPLDGATVVALHGFPESSATWDRITPALVEAGCRVLAPDQRGYSPGARSPQVRDYRLDELSRDVVGMLDTAGVQRCHVVGHDWGGAVAWHLAARHPQRLHTLSVLSTPHPRALAASLLTSTQVLRSSYVGFFRLPRLPELLLGTADAALLRAALRRSGMDAADVAEVAAAMSEPGALSSALAWYRAQGRGMLAEVGTIRVPTLYVWSSGDAALGRRAAELTHRWVDAPYRFEVLDGSHWLTRERPGDIARLILEQLRTNPAATPEPTPRRRQHP